MSLFYLEYYEYDYKYHNMQMENWCSVEEGFISDTAEKIWNAIYRAIQFIMRKIREFIAWAKQKIIDLRHKFKNSDPGKSSDYPPKTEPDTDRRPEGDNRKPYEMPDTRPSYDAYRQRGTAFHHAEDNDKPVVSDTGEVVVEKLFFNYNENLFHEYVRDIFNITNKYTDLVLHNVDEATKKTGRYIHELFTDKSKKTITLEFIKVNKAYNLRNNQTVTFADSKAIQDKLEEVTKECENVNFIMDKYQKTMLVVKDGIQKEKTNVSTNYHIDIDDFDRKLRDLPESSLKSYNILRYTSDVLKIMIKEGTSMANILLSDTTNIQKVVNKI